MIVLIDDVRNVSNVNIICRDFNSALILIEKCLTNITHLILDHDLGDENIRSNGHELLKIILGYDYKVDKIQLISMNPVGKKNMENSLLDAGYTKQYGDIYILNKE